MVRKGRFSQATPTVCRRVTNCAVLLVILVARSSTTCTYRPVLHGPLAFWLDEHAAWSRAAPTFCVPAFSPCGVTVPPSQTR
jgi:hypothetical protein